MSVVHLHHKETSNLGSVMSRAFGLLKAIHRAIATAKLERIESELILRRGYDEPVQHDTIRYPQRPLILSDKWDF